MQDFQSDFVFQHCHGKKWISYSDEELKILNKAFRRDNKSVTLQNNEKKKIVINFEEMLQKNKVSNVTQKIRALIFTNGCFYAWMYEDGEDNYCGFRLYQMFLLEAAFQQKLKKIKFHEAIRRESEDFTVDLKNMLRIDEDNNESWTVVREKVKLNRTAEIEEIEHQNKRLLDEFHIHAIKACENRIYNSHLFPKQIPLDSTKELRKSLTLSDEVMENFKSKKITRATVHHDCINAEDYKVYSAGNLYYSVALSHTCISGNINKHVFMQILVDEEDEEDKYKLFESCGRIGFKANTTLTSYGKKLHDAVHDFKEKFYEKTRNEWKDIKNFMKVPGKYDLLQLDMSSELMQERSSARPRLDREVEVLISLITSREKINEIMEEWKYDSQSIPLGKLSLSQIKEGYSALNKIVKKISDDAKGKDLVESCDEFYTKIPHNFGRKQPPVIQTVLEVEEKLRLLETLVNINRATDIFNEIPSAFKHPLDQFYDYINCDIKPINENDQEFKIIKKYFTETHGPTHEREMYIEKVFSCHKETTFLDVGKKYLLWHGSRLTNWAGILKEGLQIAPSEAPSTGTMFGKGLYFADVSSKSANYCYATKTGDRGVMLLCEVSIGNSLELVHAAENMSENLLEGYNSITGLGKIAPKSFEYILSISSRFQIPKGPLEEKTVTTALDYNEYVVYNPQQVRMKYLVIVQFDDLP